MARVTVVNDNPDFLELMGEILEIERYDTTTIDADAADVPERIRAARPDVLVLDLRMGTGGPHGWDVAKELRGGGEFRNLPVLICSADLQAIREIEDELKGQRAVAVLQKPFGIDQLTERIEELLRDRL